MSEPSTYVPVSTDLAAAGSKTSPQLPTVIRWIRQSDGAVIAEIFGADENGEDSLSLRAIGVPPSTKADINLQAISPTQQAILDLFAGGPADSPHANADLTVGARVLRLLDSAGGSHFLKMLVPGSGEDSYFPALDIAITWGSASVTWGGGSRLTPNTPVPHGIGRIPILAVPVPTGTSNLFVPVVSKDITNVVFIGNTLDGSSPAAGTTRNFDWLAIG